jgi:hypothetical protein
MDKFLVKKATRKLCVVSFLFMLALAFSGYGVAYGESIEKIEKLPQQTQFGLFDPFSLKVTDTSKNLIAGNNNLIIVTPKLPKSVYIKAQVQVPSRPELRSPFRPPL